MMLRSVVVITTISVIIVCVCLCACLPVCLCLFVCADTTVQVPSKVWRRCWIPLAVVTGDYELPHMGVGD